MLQEAPVTGGPLVAALDPAEIELYATSVEQMAEFYGVDSSERVDVVRWVLLEEQSDTWDACMTDLGYVVNPPGGIDAPPEQFDVVQRDLFRCYSKYPPHPSYVQLWGQDQIEAQYAWMVEMLIPCIEDAGHPVTDVPSKATFVQEWPTAPFYPMAQVPTGEIPALDLQCMQQAPSAVLWEGVSPADWKRGMSQVVEYDGQ